MARRANDTWRANDGTLFEGEDAKARAKRHDAWCELQDWCRAVDTFGADELAEAMSENGDILIRILRANPEKGGAA